VTALEKHNRNYAKCSRKSLVCTDLRRVPFSSVLDHVTNAFCLLTLRTFGTFRMIGEGIGCLNQLPD